jgi:NADPH-dependent curcumin reductase CurA
VVTGFVVGEVVETRDPAYAVGQVVTGGWGWREVADVAASALEPAPERGALPLAALLGVLGVPGVTAYVGVLDVGRVRPGERVLVTSAAGGVGSIAAQVAKVGGAHVTGLAGGAEKCAWLRDDLGLDATVDHRAEPDLDAAFARAFPDGVDVVFENVGNRVLDAVLPHLRDHGRVVVCGQVEDMDLPEEQRHALRNTRGLVARRLRIEGFVALDHRDRFDAARADLRAWAEQGRVRTREDVTVGFEHLPAVFASVFTGGGLGRRLVAPATPTP